MSGVLPAAEGCETYLSLFLVPAVVRSAPMLILSPRDSGKQHAKKHRRPVYIVRSLQDVKELIKR